VFESSSVVTSLLGLLAWSKMGTEKGWTTLFLIQAASQKYPGEKRDPKCHDKRGSGTE
jgi:hypothetical protein